MSDVIPISVVELSKYVEVVPFQFVINSPALEFAPLLKVYFTNADVYDPVA